MTATRERSTNMLQEAFHTRERTPRPVCHPLGGTLNGPWARAALYRLLGKLNTAPSGVGLAATGGTLLIMLCSSGTG